LLSLAAILWLARVITSVNALPAINQTNQHPYFPVKMIMEYLQLLWTHCYQSHRLETFYFCLIPSLLMYHPGWKIFESGSATLALANILLAVMHVRCYKSKVKKWKDNYRYRSECCGSELFFSFKCLIFEFSQKFSFYNSVWIRIRIRIPTIFSDSDPAKTFGLFRIRIHNTAVRYVIMLVLQRQNRTKNIGCWI
jgi:hypothetical protein